MPDAQSRAAGGRKTSLTAKIAIIGAGPAGLSAAKLLAEAGVPGVIVFEARAWPGGKALSLIEGGGLHELGTCYSTLDHHATNRWMRNIGIEQVPLGRQMFDGAPFLDYVCAGPGLPLAIEAERYLRLGAIHRLGVERRPDDPKIIEECAQPIGEWLEHHKFVRMRRLMYRALTTMGYGFLDEVPTVQALRWCTPGVLATGAFGALRMPIDGWQSFWLRLSEQLDVRLNEPAVEVTREGPGGRLTTSTMECRFEHLLVTIPLDDFAALTPLSAVEREIADAIEWGHYATALVRVDNWFTHYETDAFSRAVESGAERGHLLAARRPPVRLRQPAPPGKGELYVCGQYADRGEAELDRLLRADIEARGARLLDVVHRKIWRYFPRYRSEAIRAGLLGHMQRIQGENRTWYSGAAFSHEAVSNITSFNERLVRQILRRVR